MQHLKNIMFGGVGVNHIRLQVDPPVSLSNLVDPSCLSALPISTHFNDNEQVTLCPLEEVAEDVEIDFSKAEDFMQLETPIDARRDTDKLKLAYTIPACTFMSRLLRGYPVNRKRLAFIQRRPHSSKPMHVGNTASLAKGDGKDVAVSCQVCGLRFSKQHLFQRHILTHPDPENKIFLCQICGKRFNRADHLNRHSLLHQVSIFKCQQCGEEFDRASHLDRHRRKNHPLAGQPPIQTPPTTPRNLVPEDSYLSPSTSAQPTGSNLHLLASVATPESAALQIMQEQASDNLQFINLVGPELQIGRESIVRLEQLQPESQEDKREPERPFVCEVCSHRFIRATHLRRHMRIHTGEKPFTCHICGQRYARGDYLRAHIQAHRRDKIHKCKHCGEVFHDLTRFVNHCRLLHRDMDDEYGNPRPPPDTSPPPPAPSVTLESTLAYESAEEIIVSMNEMTTSQMMTTTPVASSESHLFHPHPHFSHSHPSHPHPSHSQPFPASHDMIQLTLVNIDPDPSAEAIITSSHAPPSHRYTPHNLHHLPPMQSLGNSGHHDLLLQSGPLSIPDTANEITVLSQPKPLPLVYGSGNHGDPLLHYIVPNGSLAHSQPLHHP